MASTPVEILMYTSAAGRSPFIEWLNRLRDVSGRAVIRARIARLRLGNFGDCKAVGGGVSELRVDYGPGYRLYLGRESGLIVVLLCGGDKKSQKSDIVQAQRLWADYRSRGDDQE